MNSLLLLRPDKAGDLIKTLPALRALVQTCPQTSVHLLVSKANESLLKFEPKLSYSTLPQQWEKLSEEALTSELKALLGGKSFDTAINLLSDSFSDVERLLSATPAEDKFSLLSPDLPAGIWPLTFTRKTPAGRSESQNVAELISQVIGQNLVSLTETMDRAPKLGELDFGEANINLGKRMGARLAICPFAGTIQRTHPLKKWKFLIQHILKKNFFSQVAVFGAPSDSDALTEIRNSLGSPEPLLLVFPSSFRSLGAHLKLCDRVVAVDSGPLHLSLALGVPSLGFLSGGDRLRWFSEISSQDKIIPRGLLDKYPSYLEMVWHFSKWK